MRFEIKNRHNKRVVILVDKAENQIGLAFVMHGLGGFKEEEHIAVFAKAFLENNITAVRFDATHSKGESDGKLEDATLINYYEDLVDVIAWAEEQDFYTEPFYMAGHSLGGISTAFYAQKNPSKVKALAPISTVVSAKLFLKANPLQINPIYKSLLKYDLRRIAKKLTMPVLMLAGENDNATPTKHQKLFFERLPGKRQMHIIKNAGHTFKEKTHLDEAKEIFCKWVQSCC